MWFTNLHMKILSIFSPQTFAIQGISTQNIDNLIWHSPNPPRGKKILKRRFDFSGCGTEISSRIIWNNPKLSDDWHREFYEFMWLADISSTGNHRVASSLAREFINGFISVAKFELPELAWDKEVSGARIAMWLTYRKFILRGSSKQFRKKFGRSIADHIHLLLNSKLELKSAWGLCAISAFLPDFKKININISPIITSEFGNDFFHKSQNPTIHLEALRILENIAELEDINENILKNIAKALQVTLHGDGRLALFNGSIMGDKNIITQALELANINIKNNDNILESNVFCRMKQNNTCIIAQKTPTNMAGIASFEFSDNHERFIVNCGGYTGQDKNWLEAITHAEAYSSISCNKSINQNCKSTVKIEDINKKLIISIASNPFSKILHKRILRITNEGGRISGKDNINGLEKCEIRFHLHPDIRTQVKKDGSLKLSSISGKIWHFSANDPEMIAVQKSVYLGHNGKPQKTMQIVLERKAENKNISIEWAFNANGTT